MSIMGIERLTTSLLVEAKKEADGLVKAAEWHLEKMLMEEKAKRAILLKKAEEDAVLLVEEQCKERLAWASLESRRILGEAREDAINAVLEDLYAMLGEVARKAEYKDFLRRTVANALDEMRTCPSLSIRCRKIDTPIVQAVIGNTSVAIDDTLDSTGGFIIESRDGRIRINITLEALFDAKREDLRKLIYQKLFGAGPSQKQGKERRAGTEKIKADKNPK